MCACVARRLAREKMIAQYAPHLVAQLVAEELVRIERKLAAAGADAPWSEELGALM